MTMQLGLLEKNILLQFELPRRLQFKLRHCDTFPFIPADPGGFNRNFWKFFNLIFRSDMMFKLEPMADLELEITLFLLLVIFIISLH